MQCRISIHTLYFPNPTIIVSMSPATSQHWRSFGQGGCSVGTLRPAPRRVHTRPNSHGVSHAAAIVYPERENPVMIVSEGVAFVKRLILIWIFFCPFALDLGPLFVRTLITYFYLRMLATRLMLHCQHAIRSFVTHFSLPITTDWLLYYPWSYRVFISST